MFLLKKTSDDYLSNSWDYISHSLLVYIPCGIIYLSSSWDYIPHSLLVYIPRGIIYFWMTLHLISNKPTSLRETSVAPYTFHEIPLPLTFRQAKMPS